MPRTSGKHFSPNIKYPTTWSGWERDDEHQRFKSYRLVAPGEYEWDYKDYNTTTQSQASSSYQETPYNYGTTSQSSASSTVYAYPEPTQASSSYQSTPETPYNYGTTSQSLASSTIYAYPEPTQASSSYSSTSQATSGLHPISESPPYTSPLQYTHRSGLDNVTNNMQNMSLGDEKDKDPPKTGTVIRTRNRHKDTEQGPFGGIHYKVHHQNDFKAGKIVMLNWVEPSGSSKSKDSNRSEHTVITKELGIGKDGIEQYQKVRRFLIVKAFKGHCLCLPINTYSFQGVNKHGVHADNHAVIYSEYPPIYLPGEQQKGLSRPAILMLPDSPASKLHHTSRLNYAKLYTIEYNVKVRFIGRVDDSSAPLVAASYNEIHPAMEPFPSATSQSQSLGESSRSSKPTYRETGTSYPVASQVSTTNYGLDYSGSASYTSNVAPHNSSAPFRQTPTYGSNVPYASNSQYYQGRGSGYNGIAYGSSTPSSGVPRISTQTNNPTYNPNYSLSMSSQQPPYYPSQRQNLPSSSFPGGGEYQTEDYSNTNYSKREYRDPDDIYHDK